jgi:hypothetical protein
MKGTIEVENEGTSHEVIFVRYETTWSSEPVLQTMWWRVDRVVRDPYRPAWPKTGDVVVSRGSDDWSGPGYSVRFPGNRQAERDAREPIPCPKVRVGVETRWNRYTSQWEKLLKKGWVRA